MQRRRGKGENENPLAHLGERGLGVRGLILPQISTRETKIFQTPKSRLDQFPPISKPNVSKEPSQPNRSQNH